MPTKKSKILTVGGAGNSFQGVMINISPKDLPPYLFQKLINLEPAEKIGSLKKRGRYKTLLTDQGYIPSIKEFLDSNNNRQIIGLKEVDLYESVWVGGYVDYGSFVQITNQSPDKRYTKDPIENVYPVIFDKVYRSGAGIYEGYSLPLWYGYIAEQLRFPTGGTRIGESVTHIEVTLDASKYLCDQLLYRESLNGFSWIEAATVGNYKTGEGLNAAFTATEQKYIYAYVVPVFDGYQTGFIKNSFYQVYGRSAIVVKIPYHATDRYSFRLHIQVHNTALQDNPRLTHFAVFVSNLQDVNLYQAESGYINTLMPAYFLEKIPLTDDADTIINVNGTFENDPTPTYIEFTDDFVNWETFNMNGFYAQISNGISFRLGSRSVVGSKVRYAVSDVPTNYDSDNYDFAIKSKWYNDASNYMNIYAIYDDFYRKLGAYYPDYSGIPEGDTGLIDPRYKYACEAGRRYFIFGREDGFGYYSLAGKPDVIPALNIIRLKFKETGCINIDKDVLIFGKFRSARVQVLSDENAVQDDEFLNVGCTCQTSIIKLDEYNIAWMSYKGPYLLLGRESKPIGDPLYEWWDSKITSSIMENCISAYNHKKDQIWFSFPAYSDDDFPNGVVFVFDLKAYRKNFISCWYYFRSDIIPISMDLNTDGHLLGLGYVSNIYNLVDWSHSSPTENCDFLMKLAILENELFSKKLRNYFKKLYIDYETSDTVQARIYIDGAASPVNLVMDTNREAFIRKLSETLELEILGDESVNDVEIKKVQLMFTEKSF